MNKEQKEGVHFEIEFESGGAKYRGRYRVAKNKKYSTITAYYDGRRKTTTLDGNDSDSLARLLIMEIVNEKKVEQERKE